MPLECVAIRKAAQNQMVSGKCDRCIMVPAVTEVSFRHLAQIKGKHLPAGRPPGFFCVAARAAEAVRPAPVSQIRGASRIVREPLLEFAQGAGEVSHERALRCLCSRYVLTIRRLLRHLHMVAIRPTGFRGISNSVSCSTIFTILLFPNALTVPIPLCTVFSVLSVYSISTFFVAPTSEGRKETATTFSIGTVTRKNPHFGNEICLLSTEIYMKEKSTGKNSAKIATSVSIFNMLSQSFPDVISNMKKKARTNNAKPQAIVRVAVDILNIFLIRKW